MTSNIYYKFIFLFYFKIPQKVQNILDETILKIQNQIEDAEKLKDEANNILSNLKNE